MSMPDQGAIEAIAHGRHGDPFAILGPHEGPDGWSVRAFLPGADGAAVIGGDGSVLGSLQRLHHDGFWAGTIPSHVPYSLRFETPLGTYETPDTYAFPPTLGDIDLHLLAEGRHRRLGHVLGAHPAEMQGVQGVRFAVWAPNASRVSVVGDFNFWDARRHPMRRHVGAGVWDLFIPGIAAGAIYKYDLLGPHGEPLAQKADPVAWAAELPPRTGSVVASDRPWRWTDGPWMQRRGAAQGPTAPISTYEVHATSWLPASMEGEAGWMGLADRLAPYCAGLGFTHIELLPIMEHPFGGSWGYQPLGQFAPSSRLGAPEHFAAFVDRCHLMGIGVILDWVPAHFPTDAHGLARFDGTALYEHGDPREGFHQDWNTLIFNLGRNEVRGFLIASALFWLEHYHVDGLRVDAVASMLYRDYSRNPGEWVPNKYGGRENLESVAFLQELSRAVAEHAPGALLIAEESTAWPGVTRSADEGGLGFHYKWNMGWMHDTLHYMQEDPVNRRFHHDEITFGLIYAFSERFALPLSHDEVVYGKGSMIRKMPGDTWQKFANLRAYYAFMWTYPGKKLLFMGCEFAQDREWNHDTGLDWDLLDQPHHAGMRDLIRDLNGAYRSTPALHQGDCDPRGFRWVVVGDSANSVFAMLRLPLDGGAPALVVCNFTPVPRHAYRVGVPHAGAWREVLNTDAARYGGSNIGNGGGVAADDEPSHGFPASLSLTLPPLATLIFQA
ncbi:MAG: 1,4-alpha-glucan branching protein GlgB [Gemmatimonadaceae bacterium]|nr:1,4-alpha-glucan branching protein GlgB [Acetobacteraceae bacterium]